MVRFAARRDPERFEEVPRWRQQLQSERAVKKMSKKLLVKEILERRESQVEASCTGSQADWVGRREESWGDAEAELASPESALLEGYSSFATRDAAMRRAADIGMPPNCDDDQDDDPWLCHTYCCASHHDDEAGEGGCWGDKSPVEEVHLDPGPKTKSPRADDDSFSACCIS